MGTDYRLESDSMGEMRVPQHVLYGAQTARAIENFPISHRRFSRPFIWALGLIKLHAAGANQILGLLPMNLSEAITQAAGEVRDGLLDAEFVVDVFQSGSGTSTNMNANEVIANRAIEILGGRRGNKSVHPNDHVNLGQSSNDVIPSAIHLSVLKEIRDKLTPALEELHHELLVKASAFDCIPKIGRTHLQDAVPLKLGQEFSGYASQIEHGLHRMRKLIPELEELPLGGTAVGTGINTHPKFARNVIERLSLETGFQLREAMNHFESQGARDACVMASGVLKTIAISLIKIACDIRLLGSGPRLGLGELRIPPTQPGSSIMPGKVNPVICEMVVQVGAQVIGNDAAIAWGGAFGNLELNTMMPLIAYNLLESIELLSNAATQFSRRCISGLEADELHCRTGIERSLALATLLVPAIGYDQAASIAKKAYENNRSVREVALEMAGLAREALESLLGKTGSNETPGSSPISK